MAAALTEPMMFGQGRSRGIKLLAFAYTWGQFPEVHNPQHSWSSRVRTEDRVLGLSRGVDKALLLGERTGDLTGDLMLPLATDLDSLTRW